MKTDKKFYCNIELALDIIGGKWKPLIIYHLSHKETLRFGQFKRLIPDVNERVLSRALRELEENDIIQRHDFNENPPRVEYRLSQTGLALSPVIVGLGNWGKDYNEKYDYADMFFINQYDDDSC